MVRRKRYAPRIAVGLLLTLVVGVIGLYHDRAIAQKAEVQLQPQLTG